MVYVEEKETFAKTSGKAWGNNLSGNAIIAIFIWVRIGECSWKSL